MSMVTRLLSVCPVTDRTGSAESGETPALLRDLVTKVGGCTLDHGFYRFHTARTATEANVACAALIDGFAGRFHCFAFDWLGREIAVNVRGRRPAVIVVDPGWGEYCRTDCELDEWHDVMCGEDDLLAHSFYQEWQQANPGIVLRFDQVVGYRIPLFLGGPEEVSNLELTDREVYFELST
ncbi:hypothetical protein ACFFWC_08865 [Plantactinospora siamensis]|uniref:Uncharacterized protein n=1 Tax=Plantactinospora siamensis TaxID=555372 RepID=A0ABV6P480_9ACTN